MKESFRTAGVCTDQIDLEIEDGIIRSVSFRGGCNGNQSGIASLVAGMKAEDVAARLKGTRCGGKQTSCPDQLARAIERMLAQPESR